MRPNNPAVYECPKGKQSLHTWKRMDDKTAECQKCGLKLTREQADEVFTERK